jgi:MFS family permease
MRHRRSTNPAMLAIVGEGFVSRLSFGMVAFALPLYARELGMSLTAIGLLASLNMMVALALKPLMGIVADRIGLRLGLSISILARSAVTALLAIATVPWQLFGARALHGVSIALRDPSVNALIAEHGGKKAIAQSFAWYQTAKSVGGSLSKVAAGVLITLTASDFSIVFLAAFALSLAPVLIVTRYVREPERTAAPGPRPTAEDEATDATENAPGGRPPTLRFAGAGVLIGASTHMLNTFFPILATEYAGLSAAQAGGLYTIGAVAALAGPAFGWLSDNVSRALVLQIRSAANVISSVLYYAFPNLAGFAAGRLLDDLGKAAFKPAWGSMMAHVSSYDRRRRAQIMGTISSGEDAGEMLGPILAGLLWATGGVTLLLGGRVALALGAEVYMMVLAHGTDDDGADVRHARRLRRVVGATAAVPFAVGGIAVAAVIRSGEQRDPTPARSASRPERAESPATSVAAAPTGSDRSHTGSARTGEGDKGGRKRTRRRSGRRAGTATRPKPAPSAAPVSTLRPAPAVRTPARAPHQAPTAAPRPTKPPAPRPATAPVTKPIIPADPEPTPPSAEPGRQPPG